jgi:phage tail-like protein
LSESCLKFIISNLQFLIYISESRLKFIISNLQFLIYIKETAMGRTPYSIDVTANQGSLGDLTPVFNFIVMLNVFTYGFQEVSGLEISRPYSTYEEGGVNDHPIVVGTPETSAKTLTFRRGMIIKKNSLITDLARMGAAAIPNNLARKAALLGITSLDSAASLEEGPAIGFVQVFDRHFENDIATFGFLSLGMSEWKMSDLDAQANNLVIEDFTIVHTGLKRLTTNLTPSFISSFFSSDDYNSEYFYEGSHSTMPNDQSAAKQESVQQNETAQEKVSQTPAQKADEAIKEAKTASEEAVEAAKQVRIADLLKAAAEKRAAEIEKERQELEEKKSEIQAMQEEAAEESRKLQQNITEAAEEHARNMESLKNAEEQARAEARRAYEDSMKELEERRAALAQKNAEIKKSREEANNEAEKMQQEIAKSKEENDKAREELQKAREEATEAARKSREAAEAAEAAADELENSEENDKSKVNEAKAAALQAEAGAVAAEDALESVS